jgi:uncharacterized protein (TIGR03437 family)
MRLATRLVATLFACSPAAVAQLPAINAVVSQATLAPPVAPGMPVAVNGSNLAGSGFVDCPGPRVPLTCGSVSVTVNNQVVPVRSAHQYQVVTYVPVDQAPGPVNVVVKNHQGVSSAPFTVTVEQYAPGIQRLSDPSGSLLGMFSDTAMRAISRASPASPGQELTAYVVGLGPTQPVIPTGEQGTAPVTTQPRLWIGTREVPVLSAGLGCGLICDPGNYLVRFALPPDTQSGDQPVSIEVSGKRSTTVTLVVGPPSSGPVVGYLQSVLDNRVRTLAPGMVADVVGGGFMQLPGGVGQCSSDPSFWPAKCQGVTVTINGRAAAIRSLTPNYVTIQIPFEVAAGPATLIVERTMDSQTLRSAPFNFTLETLSPTLPATPVSPYPAVIIQNSGGIASPTNPMLPGDNLFLYADGLGQTNPPLVTGFTLTLPARTLLTPAITVGGKALTNIVAEVLPGMIGQYRISATVPSGLGTGDLPIVLEIGGKKSQAGLMVPVASDPVIAAVTNAASSAVGIVSGSWVSIYGRNLSATRREWTEDDFVYDWLPTELSGVTVSINGAPAAVGFISPTQLNVIAPDGLATGPAEVIVSGPLGWQKSTAMVKAYSPGLFPLGVPPGTFLLATHTDYSYVARPGQFPPNVSVRPAKPGETIVFYGTGFGPTDPQVPSYRRFSGAAPLAGGAQVRMQVGTAQAQVTYAGLVGNGLYQLNVVVPDLPDGDHEVIVSMGTETSPRGRLIPVQR